MVYTEFIGRLGTDSELKTSAKGNPFLKMRIATDEFKTGGERTTSWFSVLYPTQGAQNLMEFFKKGKLVHVHGRETVTAYMDKNNEPQVSRDVIADRIDFVPVGNGNKDNADGDKVDAAASAPQTPPPAPKPSVKTTETVTAPPTAPSVDDDELPF